MHRHDNQHLHTTLVIGLCVYLGKRISHKENLKSLNEGTWTCVPLMCLTVVRLPLFHVCTYMSAGEEIRETL